MGMTEPSLWYLRHMWPFVSWVSLVAVILRHIVARTGPSLHAWLRSCARLSLSAHVLTWVGLIHAPVHATVRGRVHLTELLSVAHPLTRHLWRGHLGVMLWLLLLLLLLWRL